MTGSAQGRDWSAYQGPVPAGDMTDLAFGYSRATSWTGDLLGSDPDFARDWAAMKQEKLHRGAYHYLKTSISAEVQAEFFVTAVRKQGLEPGDMLVCDSELPVAGADAATLAFCKRTRELAGPEYPVLIYTNHDTGQHLTSCTGWPLWIAWPSPASRPDPAIVAPWKDWKMWQWGEISQVDADVYNGSTTDLQVWLDSFLPVPATPVKVEHWKVWGRSSMNREAAEHHTIPAEMIRLAAEQHHVYGDKMKDYIRVADWDRHVPAGTTLFAEER